jgi:hypothetical protein
MIVLLERGTRSCNSSRTAGAVRATMASISAEPESRDVWPLLAETSLLCGMLVRSGA